MATFECDEAWVGLGCRVPLKECDLIGPSGHPTSSTYKCSVDHEERKVFFPSSASTGCTTWFFQLNPIIFLRAPYMFSKPHAFSNQW